VMVSWKKCHDRKFAILYLLLAEFCILEFVGYFKFLRFKEFPF
jgi:hypothetical protein